MYNPAKTEEEQYAEYELSDIEIQQLKEHNQKRVKRVVAVVAILLTVISLGLVAFSLALGKKIDLMDGTNAPTKYFSAGYEIAMRMYFDEVNPLFFHAALGFAMGFIGGMRKNF